MLDRVPHLGERKREVGTGRAQLEGSCRALAQACHAIDAACQLTGAVVNEETAQTGQHARGDRRGREQHNRQAVDRAADPGRDHQPEDNDRTRRESTRRPDEPTLDRQRPADRPELLAQFGVIGGCWRKHRHRARPPFRGCVGSMAIAAPTTSTTASAVHARLPMTHAGKRRPGAQLCGGSDSTVRNAAGAPRAKASVAEPPADSSARKGLSHNIGRNVSLPPRMANARCRPSVPNTRKSATPWANSDACSDPFRMAPKKTPSAQKNRVAVHRMVISAMTWSPCTPPNDQAGAKKGTPTESNSRLNTRAARTLPSTMRAGPGPCRSNRSSVPRSRSPANADAETAGATTAAARMTHNPTAPNRRMARLATSRLVLVVDVVENSAGAAFASGARISTPSRNTSSATSSTSRVNAAKVSRPRSHVWNSLMTSAPIKGTLDYPATAWKSLASATAGERRSIPKWATLHPARISWGKRLASAS